MGRKNVYRVIFINQGKVYELFAEKVKQGGLFGFVEVEGLFCSGKRVPSWSTLPRSASRANSRV